MGGAAAGPAWQGLYVGATGGVLFASGGTGAAPLTGAHFGFNFVRNSFVGGVEVEVMTLTAGATSAGIAFLNASGGFALGSNALVYGEVGVGRVLGAATTVYAYGVGVEFGLNSNLSSSFEFKGLGGLGAGTAAFLIQWSLNWRP